MRTSHKKYSQRRRVTKYNFRSVRNTRKESEIAL